MWLLLPAVLLVAAVLIVARFSGLFGPRDAFAHPPIPDPDRSVMQPRVAEAMQEARQAVLQEPRSAEAWGHYGEVLEVHDLHLLAIDCYRTAHDLDPTSFRWAYDLAIALELQGRAPGEMIELFHEAAQLEPSYPPVHFRLGDALTREGRIDEALDAYATAIKLDPQLGIAHRSLGQALLIAGNAQEALGYLERAASLAPDDQPTFAALARCYQMLGDERSAEDAARGSEGMGYTLGLNDPIRAEVEQLGVSSEAAAKRAAAAMARQDFAQAIADLLIVIEAHPDDASAHLQLGRAYLQTRRQREAVEQFTAALRIREDLAGAHVGLGTILLGQREIDRAVAHLQRAIEITPRHATAHAKLGTALAQAGRIDDAITAFEHAATYASTLDAQTLHNWGNALLRRGDVSGAVQRLLEAVQAKPDYARAHESLGRALEMANRRNEAIEHYRIAARLDPSSRARQRLAQLGVTP